MSDFYILKKKVVVYPVYGAYALYPSGGEPLIIDEEVVRCLRTLSSGAMLPVLGAADYLRDLQKHSIIGTVSSPSGNGNLFKDLYKEYQVGDDIKSKYQGSFSHFEYIPSRLEIDFTNACNFGCIHCSREAGYSKEAELSTSELISVLEQASQLGILNLTIMGGEPLVRPDIGTLLHFIKGRFPFVTIGTNGWHVEKYAKDLAGVAKIVQISLHGASAESHDNFVNKRGAFDRALRAIRLMRELGISIVISHTITPKNIEEYSKMFELAKDLGVDNLRFIRMAWIGRAQQLTRLTWHDICKAESTICGLRNQYKTNVEGGGLRTGQEPNGQAYFFGCSAGRSLMCIDSTGNVILCVGIEESIGNVRERDLLSIWHDDKYLRSRMINSNCNGCLHLNRCAGPCRVGRLTPFEPYGRNNDSRLCFSDPNLNVSDSKTG